ncbi:MAG: tetratricopeptide repeat protein, partial [Planctomycetota bacterium]
AVAFAVQVTLQNARIRTERDRASLEGEVSGEVSDFLVGLFRLADPTETAGEVVTAEMLLSRGTSEIRASVGSSPAVRAALLNSMGWAWKGLGEYARAREVLEDALDAAEPGSEDAGEVLGRLALVELKLGDYDASRAHLEASLAVAEARADGPSAAVARAESGFCELEYDLGRPDVALDHARRALGILEELHGPLDEQPHPAVASAASQLASIQELRGSFVESEALWSEVIAALRELHDGAHVDVANAQLNRSYLYRAMGRMEDARTSVLEAKEMLEEVYGPAHPDLDSAIAQLAGIATDTGDYDEAERIYTDLLERDRAAYGDHLLTSLNLNDLAGIASRKGQLDRAEEFYRAAYDMQRRVLPENHLELGTSASNLGTVLRRMRRYDEAQAYVEESLEIRRANLPPTHPNVLTSLNTLAVIFGDKQDYDRALELAEEVLDARRQKLGEHVQTAGSLYTCAHLALKSGRVDDSLEFAAESVAIFDRVAEGTNIFSASASLFLGDNLAKVGRADEGLPHLRDAARIRTELMGEEAMDAIYARLRLGEVLSEDPATAAEGRALVEAEAARAREVLGDGHPLTKRAARSLEDIRDPKG